MTLQSKNKYKGKEKKVNPKNLRLEPRSWQQKLQALATYLVPIKVPEGGGGWGEGISSSSINSTGPPSAAFTFLYKLTFFTTSMNTPPPSFPLHLPPLFYSLYLSLSYCLSPSLYVSLSIYLPLSFLLFPRLSISFYLSTSLSFSNTLFVHSLYLSFYLSLRFLQCLSDSLILPPP